MNWLGLTTKAFIAAVLGALLGAVAYAYGLTHGWDAPYLVGVAAGLGAMLGSRDRSGLRGLVIASCAIWVAALVQSHVGPHAGANLLAFHTTLTPLRWLTFAACGAAAFFLAKTSARKNAPTRAAGA
jgi:hypothetical protein